MLYFYAYESFFAGSRALNPESPKKEDPRYEADLPLSRALQTGGGPDHQALAVRPEILVVSDSDGVEQDTHESLMLQKGFYYKLYASQFQ